MITRFLSEVTASFNPFSASAKSARSFIALLPANARQTMKVNIKVLPRTAEDPATVHTKFTDGHTIDLNFNATSLKSAMEQVDRHSRALARKADLSN